MACLFLVEAIILLFLFFFKFFEALFLQVQASSNATGTSEVMPIGTSSPALALKAASLQIMPKSKQALALEAQTS